MKQLIPKKLEAYATAHSAAESPECRAIREETYRTQDSPQMVVGPLEAAFLRVMAQSVGARHILEIGTFTGYSALAMAEAIPHDGTIMTCEIDKETAAVAKSYWAKSPHGRKIELKVGPALETIAHITGPFDLIFIDADKSNYLNYYRRALDLIAPTGVILIDNVLWSGEVLKDPAPDSSTAVIQDLNRTIAADRGVTAVLLTLRDGVFVIKPKPK
jgi:caffeoyl-CoA O-methyltransferase